MPSRRRPTTTLAALLPVSRLPLGTPQISPRSPPDTRSLTHSPHSRRSENSSSAATQSSAPNSYEGEAVLISATDSQMASKDVIDPLSAKSIAEAKLERQKKRNEEADAALTGGAQHKKRASRAKGKQWKPFDYSSDVTQAPGINEPVSMAQDARVGLFRIPSGVPLSRGSSLSRPVSSTSHRSSEIGPVDMERQDSGLPGGGFQVAKGRRHRRVGGDGGAYQDSHEGRQKTVEATFDAREIYEVFGNALPGPEFMEQNPGFSTGQLQFVQHPNGDISAHQWSADRYIWENIGQFSNIRKKVEGQLASDRLKGETAYQTLQQNTLAYFRIIAKQREAAVMGVPFGAKEIHAAIPEPHNEIITGAPTGLKEEARNDDVSHPAHMQAGIQEAKKNEQVGNAPNVPLRPVPPLAPLPLNASRNQAPPNFTHSGYGMLGGRQDDPFYSANTYQQIYGNNPYPNQYYDYNQPGRSSMYGPFLGLGQQSQGLNYDFHFPQTHAVDSSTQRPDVQASYTQRTAIPVRPVQPWQRVQGTNVAGSGAGEHSQYATDRASTEKFPGGVSNTQVAGMTAVTASRLTPGRPGRRTPMSAELWKISDSAKERSLSQANIRTVLYDPFQAAAAKENEGYAQGPMGPSHSVLENAAGVGLPPASSLNPASARFFPAIPVPQITRPTSTVPTELTNLGNSSPEHPKLEQPYQHGMMTPIAPPAGIEINKGHLGLQGIAVADEVAERKAYDEECTKWWHSGNKFARQQDFYERVMKADTNISPQTARRTQPTITSGLSPTKHPAPSTDYNTTTTRILIPVLENLAAYVQDRAQGRRDYFCPWTQAPEWAIDRSEHGNNSFFDDDEQWGSPPARVGRDPRYSSSRPVWPSEQQTVPRYGGPGSGRNPGAGKLFGSFFGSGSERRVGYVGQRLR